MRRSTGQFVIPQQLVDLITKLAEFYGGETIVDPWCHFPELLRACEFAQRRIGFVRDASLYNEIVLEEPSLDLRNQDVFQQDTDDVFDIVLWGPPWGVNVQYGTRQHRVEAFILDRSIELLAPNGVAICLVPPNVLSDSLWSKTRQKITRVFDLQLTVELPAQMITHFAFAPSIIAFKKSKPGDRVFMAEYSADHYEFLENLRAGTGDFMVSTDAIHDRWDRHFHDPKFEFMLDRLAAFPTNTIEEMGEVFSGLNRTSEQESPNGDYRLLRARDLRRGNIDDESPVFVRKSDDRRFQRAILRPGDILINSVNPKVYIYRQEDPPAVAHHTLLVVRSQEHDYLGAYLQTDDGRWLFETQVDRKATRLGSYARLTVQQLRAFKIPRVRLTYPELLDSRKRETATISQLESLSRELLNLRNQNLKLRHELEQEQARRQQAAEQLATFDTPIRDTDITRRFFEEQFASVHDQLTLLRSSVDGIRAVLDGVAKNVLAVKSAERDVEEKLVRLYGQMDRLTSRIDDSSSPDYATYGEIVCVWLGDLATLHSRSQVFLASGEHLLDLLSEQPDSEFSPFVIQYCRSVENELAEKLFCPYHVDLYSRIDDVVAFIEADLSDRQGKQYRFANRIKIDARKHTLGEMYWVLNLARAGGNTIADSPVLQDFAKFANRKFGDWVTSVETVKLITKVTEEFRNQAAHLETLDKTIALDCQALVRDVIGQIVAHYRGSPPSGRTEE